MSDGSHDRKSSGIERRRQSLRNKCYAGCETIARRSRNDHLDDDSVRSSPRRSRGSISERSGFSLKDEDWDTLKEALTQLA